MKNLKLAECFKEAATHIYLTFDDLFEPSKCVHVHAAIFNTHSNIKIQRAAYKIIYERTNGLFVEDYLQNVYNINDELLTNNNLQYFKIEWLEALALEFSGKDYPKEFIPNLR